MMETHARALGDIIPGATWGGFTNLPHVVAKAQLKAAVERIQEARWRSNENVNGFRTMHAGMSKTKWGLDSSLLKMRPSLVTTYVRVRNGVGIEDRHMEGSTCSYCKTDPQSELHLLWVCSGTTEARTTFIRAIQHEAPRVAEKMLKLTAIPMFHFMMGAGAKETGEDEWEIFQAKAVEFVSEAFGERKRPAT